MDGGDAAVGEAVNDGKLRPFDILDDDAGHGADPFPKTDSDMDICSAMLKSVMARAHKILLIIKNGG